MIAQECGEVIIGENVYEANTFDFFIITEGNPHQLKNMKVTLS